MEHNIIRIVKKQILRLQGVKSPSSQTMRLKWSKVVVLSIFWQITISGVVSISGCSSEFTGEHSGGQGKQAQQEAGNTAAKSTHKEIGEASWYGPGFQGKETANGEIFDPKDMTAAHPTLPMGTKAKVTNLENGKKIEVRINDRGPFAADRAIDLSNAAAKKLEMKKGGTAEVKIETKTTQKK
jgi:rare lipoprotein A (peptidoglycan hydrolase)